MYVWAKENPGYKALKEIHLEISALCSGTMAGHPRFKATIVSGGRAFLRATSVAFAFGCYLSAD